MKPGQIIRVLTDGLKTNFLHGGVYKLSYAFRISRNQFRVKKSNNEFDEKVKIFGKP